MAKESQRTEIKKYMKKIKQAQNDNNRQEVRRRSKELMKYLQQQGIALRGGTDE